ARARRLNAIFLSTDPHYPSQVSEPETTKHPRLGGKPRHVCQDNPHRAGSNLSFGPMIEGRWNKKARMGIAASGLGVSNRGGGGKRDTPLQSTPVFTACL